jgi:hypothetical protein
MRFLALALACLLLLASPASAGTQQDPEMTDPCGFGIEEGQEPVLESLDLCSTWFETVSTSGAPEIKVVMDLVDLTDRPDGIYWVEWTSGGCNYLVERHDGGRGETPGDAAAHFTGSCPQEVPCVPGVGDLPATETHCWTSVNRVEADISDSFAEVDGRFEWTIRFDGALASHAPNHATGAVLEPVLSYTALEVAGGWGLVGYDHCEQDADGKWTCTGAVTDRIYEGRDYVVGS